MKAKIEFGLEGAFKADLYSGNTLMESTDWFKNFITHTGLSYPAVYPFADCFRYLSIGSSVGFNIANSGYVAGSGQYATTGLYAPIASYQTTSGSQRGTYIGWEGYEVGQDGQQSPCGTVLTEQGPAFFRAWSIPTGDAGIVMNEANPNGLQIGEFMVSPSSGNDQQGKYAFSRITRNLSIPNGWRAIISYQLRIKMQNTGLTLLAANSFATGNADVSNDLALVDGWKNLSGVFRQVFPSLMFVDTVGSSFVSRFGAVMEPSLSNLSQMTFYLSPDNAEFDVNNVAGGAQSNVNRAYLSDGIMQQVALSNLDVNYSPNGFDSKTPAAKKAYYELLPSDPNKFQTNVPDTTEFPTPINIRLGDSSTPLVTPSLAHYSVDNSADIGNFNYQAFQKATEHEISYATVGGTGIDTTKVNFGQKAVFSTRVFRLPTYNPTGRKKTQTRRTMFAPVTSLGVNTRFGSLVAAYRTDTTTTQPAWTTYPIVDCLFFNTSGRALMPHYRVISGIYLYERGSGVADAWFSILPKGENTQRFSSRRSVNGAIYGGVLQDANNWFTNGGEFDDRTQFLLGGPLVDTVEGSDVTDPSYTWNGSSGYGAVIGVQGASFTGSPLDCGLTDHNLGVIGGVPFLQQAGEPSNSSTIYWPTPTSSPLTLSITGIKYFATAGCFSAYSSVPLASGAGTYPWASNPCKFKPPTGYIVHLENIGSTGFRLLPNHGYPNNQNINNYQNKYGGAYPGLSLDNGVDLYMDISWNAPCGAAQNCVDVP